MKLYISADLEGICGLSAPSHAFPKPGDASGGYERAVLQLHTELNTLLKPILEKAEAHNLEAVVINDAHAKMVNLRLELLPKHPAVRLLSGKPKPCAMVAGLDDTFDGLLMVGYHAKAGTANATLCHSFHDALLDLRLNNVSLGELGFNALYAALAFGVPTIFASGDLALKTEAQSLIPDLLVVETKEALGFSSVLNQPWPLVEAQYTQAAHQLLAQKAHWKQQLEWAQNELSPFKAPFKLALTWREAQQADIVSLMPGMERPITECTGNQTVYTAATMTEAYRALQTAYSLVAYQTTLA